MWHWLFDIFLASCLFLFMIDKLTLCWVRRCYDLFYHLMIRTNGYLIFVDIDNFKEFNNQYGHQAGDKTLRKIGFILLSESRLRAFRYGGDELVVLLPWTNKEKAYRLAEKIRVQIEKNNIEELRVTATCVVARTEEAASKLLLQNKKNNNKNKIITEPKN